MRTKTATIVEELERVCNDLDKLSMRLTKLTDGLRAKLGSKKATGHELQTAAVVDGINDQIARLSDKYEGRLAVLTADR